MKKIISILLCILLVGSLFVGCGSSTSKSDSANVSVSDDEGKVGSKSSDEKVNLVIASIPGPTAQWLKMFADDFMKENSNVNVTIKEYEEERYKEQAPRIFSSSEKPDLAWYWIYRWYDVLVESGTLLELDDLYQKEGWDKVLPEVTIKNYTSPDGHKYAVNSDVVWTPTLFYNKKIFKEVGVDAPKTFDEWFAAGEKLKKAGYIPLVSGTGQGYVVGHIWSAILSRTVPEDKYLKLLEGKKYEDINYTSPEVIESWKLLKDMSEKLMPQGASGLNDEDARSMFVQGKAAMYSHGSWAASLLQTELPEDFELGYMYYPAAKADIKPKTPLFDRNGLVIIKGTGKEEWAKKLLAYIMSYDGQAKLAKSTLGFPSRTDMKADDLEVLGPVFVGIYNELLNTGVTGLWETDLPAELSERGFAIGQEIMNGQKTPEEAGKEMQQLFESIAKQ